MKRHIYKDEVLVARYGATRLRMAVITLDYFLKPDATYVSLAEEHDLSPSRIEQLVKDMLKIIGRHKEAMKDIDPIRVRNRIIDFLERPKAFTLSPDTPEGFYHIELHHWRQS